MRKFSRDWQRPKDPLWFEEATGRPCDDRIDLIDAEDTKYDFYGKHFSCHFTDLLRYDWDDYSGSWDFEQAIEIIAARPGLLYGERFYDLKYPSDPENDWKDFKYDQSGER